MLNGGVTPRGARWRRALTVAGLSVGAFAGLAPVFAATSARVAHAVACAPNNASFDSGGDPNNPDYNPAERGVAGSSSWNDEQWYLYGCMPFRAPLAQRRPRMPPA